MSWNLPEARKDQNASQTSRCRPRKEPSLLQTRSLYRSQQRLVLDKKRRVLGRWYHLRKDSYWAEGKYGSLFTYQMGDQCEVGLPRSPAVKVSCVFGPHWTSCKRQSAWIKMLGRRRVRALSRFCVLSFDWQLIVAELIHDSEGCHRYLSWGCWFQVLSSVRLIGLVADLIGCRSRSD